jgi:hypothetical protein
MRRPGNLRLHCRIGDSGWIVAGVGGQDGVDDVHNVLDVRFAVNREPSLQCDLAVINLCCAKTRA